MDPHPRCPEYRQPAAEICVTTPDDTGPDCIAEALDVTITALIRAEWPGQSLRWALAARLTEARVALDGLARSPAAGRDPE